MAKTLTLTELPKIHRTRGESGDGVWRERLDAAEIDQNVGQWVLVYGPVAPDKAHAASNTLKRGPAGVNAEDYEFAARELTAETAKQFGLPAPTKGKVTRRPRGGEPYEEEVEFNGYVFGRRIVADETES